MIEEDFLNFLKTGQLINFPFGIEKEKIIFLLGDTDYSIDNGESSILKYDKTEFYFYHEKSGTNRLIGIIIQPIPKSTNKGNLRMNYYWLTKNLNYYKIKNLLETEKINYNETILGNNTNEKIIKTEGQVEILFFDNNKICKIASSIHIL